MTPADYRACFEPLAVTPPELSAIDVAAGDATCLANALDGAALA